MGRGRRRVRDPSQVVQGSPCAAHTESPWAHPSPCSPRAQFEARPPAEALGPYDWTPMSMRRERRHLTVVHDPAARTTERQPTALAEVVTLVPGGRPPFDPGPEAA